MAHDLLGALVLTKKKSGSPAQASEPPAPVPPAPTPAPTLMSDPVVYVVERPLISAITGLAGAAAAGVSYSRNKSVGWALLHGILGVPYLAYVGYDQFVKKKGSRDIAVFSASDYRQMSKAELENLATLGDSKAADQLGRRDVARMEHEEEEGW